MRSNTNQGRSIHHYFSINLYIMAFPSGIPKWHFQVAFPSGIPKHGAGSIPHVGAHPLQGSDARINVLFTQEASRAPVGSPVRRFRVMQPTGTSPLATSLGGVAPPLLSPLNKTTAYAHAQSRNCTYPSFYRAAKSVLSLFSGKLPECCARFLFIACLWPPHVWKGNQSPGSRTKAPLSLCRHTPELAAAAGDAGC